MEESGGRKNGTWTPPREKKERVSGRVQIINHRLGEKVDKKGREVKHRSKDFRKVGQILTVSSCKRAGD